MPHAMQAAAPSVFQLGHTETSFFSHPVECGWGPKAAVASASATTASAVVISGARHGWEGIMGIVGRLAVVAVTVRFGWTLRGNGPISIESS